MHMLSAIAVAAAFVPAALAGTNSTSSFKSLYQPTRGPWTNSSTSAVTPPQTSGVVSLPESESEDDDSVNSLVASSTLPITVGPSATAGPMGVPMADEKSILVATTKTITRTVTSTVTACPEAAPTSCTVGEVVTKEVVYKTPQVISVSVNVLINVRIECYGNRCVVDQSKCEACKVGVALYFRVVCERGICYPEVCSYEERDTLVFKSVSHYYYSQRTVQECRMTMIECKDGLCSYQACGDQCEKSYVCRGEACKFEICKTGQCFQTVSCTLIGNCKTLPAPEGLAPKSSQLPAPPKPVGPDSKPVAPQPHGAHDKFVPLPKGPADKPYTPKGPEEKPSVPQTLENKPYIPEGLADKPYSPVGPEDKPYTPKRPGGSTPAGPGSNATPESPSVPSNQTPPSPQNVPSGFKPTPPSGPGSKPETNNPPTLVSSSSRNNAVLPLLAAIAGLLLLL